VQPWVQHSLRTHASQMHPGLTSCARHALPFVDTPQDTRKCSLVVEQYHCEAWGPLPRSLHLHRHNPYSPSSSVSQRCNDAPSELPSVPQLAPQLEHRWVYWLAPLLGHPWVYWSARSSVLTLAQVLPGIHAAAPHSPPMSYDSRDLSASRSHPGKHKYTHRRS
jgi:hypothetical protein